MEVKELKLKEAGELNEMLKGLRKNLDEAKFKSQQGQLKNIREMRVIKKDIAKIMTVLSEKSK